VIKEIIDGMAFYRVNTFDDHSSTILWLHGYTMNVSVWDDILPNMTGYNHLVLDLPGHGDSRPIDTFQSMEEFTESLSLAAERYTLEHIIGFSFGGILGLQLAIQKPNKYRSLTLISSPLGGKYVDEDASRKNRELIQLFQSRGAGPWLTECWISSPPDIFTGIKRHPQKFHRLVEIINRHTWRELENNSFGVFTAFNQFNRGLKHIRAKVFLLVGEEDMPYIKRCNQILFDAVPECERIYIPDCGHLPLLERTELTVELIRQSLAKV
jgi:pimeloyl-ACP methyl ester carboxylesterase